MTADELLERASSRLLTEYALLFGIHEEEREAEDTHTSFEFGPGDRPSLEDDDEDDDDPDEDDDGDVEPEPVNPFHVREQRHTNGRR